MAARFLAYRRGLREEVAVLHKPPPRVYGHTTTVMHDMSTPPSRVVAPHLLIGLLGEPRRGEPARQVGYGLSTRNANHMGRRGRMLKKHSPRATTYPKSIFSAMT